MNQENSAADEPAVEDATGGHPRSRAWLILRSLLGLGVFLLLVILLVRTVKPELEGLGHSFVERFGLAGVTLGALLADGFHCPIPPQFYMLLATAAGTPPMAILGATTLGSLLGGVAGFTLARRLGRIPRLEHWLERVSRGMGRKLSDKYAHRSVFFASLTPMAFSVLCYLGGLYRLRWSALALLLALRVPKLALYYYLLRVGWSGF
jgi:membrane protein YqaA with SNARE-associated domain